MNMAGGASQNIRFLILDKNGSQDSNFKKRAQTKPMPFCFGFLPDRPDDFSFNNFNRPYKISMSLAFIHQFDRIAKCILIKRQIKNNGHAIG